MTSLILPSKLVDPAERWPDIYCHNLDAITGNAWGVNEGGGRFFAASRSWTSTRGKLDLLKGIGITRFECHDTDILDLVLGLIGKDGYPTDMTEDQKMELLHQAVGILKKELTERGMVLAMFTMNLFNSDQLFVYGNMSSEVKEARDLAISRTKIGISIAQEFGCIYVDWVGTNGCNGLMSGNHMLRYQLMFDAWVQILKWHKRQHGRDGNVPIPIAGEAKPEEPMWRMYAPVTQSFLWMALQIALQFPSLAGMLGVNPEEGHEVMAKLDPSMTLGEAMTLGLLFHTHFNQQGGDPGFDRDGAAGSISLRSLIDMLWQLHITGYKGLIGLDVQPRPTDTDEQQAAAIEESIRNVKWAVDIVQNHIDDEHLLSLQAKGNQVEINRYIGETAFGIMA